MIRCLNLLIGGLTLAVTLMASGATTRPAAATTTSTSTSTASASTTAKSPRTTATAAAAATPATRPAAPAARPVRVPMLVAHRGASEAAPENTLAAFKRAFEVEAADAVEGDFYLTADGQIICIHDPTLKRTCGVEGKVADRSLAELRTLDAGRWKSAEFAGEKLPTMAEFLATIPKGKKAFVELKVGPEIVTATRRAVEDSGLGPDQVVFIAFNEQTLAAVKLAMPRYKAYLLYGFKKDRKSGQWNATGQQVIARAKALGADGVDVSFTPETREVVNAEFARAVRAASLELHVWTVDDPGLAREAIERLGVDSITTNRPQMLRTALEKGE